MPIVVCWVVLPLVVWISLCLFVCSFPCMLDFAVLLFVGVLLACVCLVFVCLRVSVCLCVCLCLCDLLACNTAILAGLYPPERWAPILSGAYTER